MKRLLIVFSIMFAFLGMTFIAPFTTSASAQVANGTRSRVITTTTYRTKHARRHHRRHRRHMRRKGTVTTTTVTRTRTITH